VFSANNSAAAPPTTHQRKKPLRGAAFLVDVGRRDWIRTNDPHHVKVVL
jgi:hypothetical protein